MVILKTIPGTFGFYKVSNCGRVWSVRSNKFLKEQKRMNGYMYVNLSICGEVFYESVHRLVLETFNPTNYTHLDGRVMHVNHKDLDKTNNNLDNLEWTSCAENLRHYHSSKKEVA